MARLFKTTTPVATGGRLFGGGQETRPDLSTTAGLQQLAGQAGLTTGLPKGEDPKKIFSGGLISDIFDTLNVFQYGVVGLLKGKGFSEGVRTRQSFTDKDSLGDRGIPGLIAGTALDILVDPMTYISPFSILKKIPGVEAGVDVAKTAFSKTRLGSSLGRSFIYRFGQDPVYKELAERSIKNVAVGNRNLLDLAKPLAELSPEAQRMIGAARKTGKLADLPADILAKAKPAFDELDKLGKQAVEVGLLDAKTYEKNVGSYMTRLYRKHEEPVEAIKKVIFPIKSKRLELSRFKRRTDIPEAIREAMGEVLEAGYPTAKGLVQINKAIENTKFFNEVAKKFSSSVPLEGFEKLPISKGLFTTATGEKIGMFKKIKELNKTLKPVLKELKRTSKLDKTLVRQIDNIIDDVGRFRRLQEKEFLKLFQAGEKVTRTVITPRRLGTLPEQLIGIAEEIRKFKNFDEFFKSNTGLKVERLFEEGALERAGFGSIKSFFNRVKKPFKEATTKIAEGEIKKGSFAKLVKLQKQVENLSRKTDILKGVEKTSIDDALRFLTNTIDSIQKEKTGAFTRIFNTELGELSGKYVPKAIFDDIEEIIRIKKPSEAALNKLIGSWKFGKVVLNPATHGRNIISNFILNSWEGLSPHRIDVYAEAGKELATKGKLYKEAVEQGLGLNTFAAQEIRQMLTGVDNASMLKRLGNKGKQAMNKIADLYQKEEEFAKMAQYIFQKKQGKTAQQAWEIAERATFNYAQVTPFIRRMRESVFGFPFLTFTAKATPQAIKTALKHPTRISNIGKIKTAIENQADLKELQRERASEPEWVRNGFYVKLPMKDKLGRSAYFDLTYILPFGDLITGDIARRTPTFINLAKELGKNKDFFGNKIWRESDSTAKKSADLMRHLIKFAAPAPIAQQIPGGIKPSGERRGGAISRVLEKEKLGIEGGGAQTRTGMQELLRNVGLKIQPVDIEQQEWWFDREKKEALQALLQESGIINQFNINYIPKEKETEKTGGRVFGK